MTIVSPIKKIAIMSSDSPEALGAADLLRETYGEVPPNDADVVVALGGDGLMLQALHAHMDSGKPIYGMNRGSVGFLMNEFRPEGLMERISEAKVEPVHPLRMSVLTADGETIMAHAVNEVALFRQSYQAAKLKITIDGHVRLEELICDGILLATPAGSTAYNLSAHGPIIPINAPLLALTPISPFRPRRWRGALLPDRAEVTLEVLETDKRPVNAVADHTEFKSVRQVSIVEDKTVTGFIMFDPDHGWDERILAEQFRY
ncbi:NAD kinase [Afifella marina]|uniref:NAD kinase n=1 Tax=Afifella marina DSM 2698 TaxID=1120955 RepID=A0A1G5P815_AFIMA|nr:NAD kinase [Afifella marina]MBK1625289.1 NAD kinase [Afifella marina DSM 2698]MBK1628831.1 NAD kinase [Afifella marina]MBK5916833.1 NAD kinase [Afifella marina]RAI17943.1 NAD kinase [Afifella marina DSM 2698]SCZ45702.1 NAD+ kinase [Afifella marina DSM 2698]